MRQLAAIVFADMVGYTALMQANEHAARHKRSRVKKVMDQALPDFRGRILQQYGDGTLCLFNSAVDAVLCATTIQRQLLEEPMVELRIGIHMADVTIEDDAIYGDGVNLASRIESLAVPGSVLVSEKVYDEIRNQQDITSVDLGFFEFKNVMHPMRVFAISDPGIVLPVRAALNGKTRLPVNRLAVLPFVNMSADPENEYFSDGITEEILNTLTQVEGLQVTSRTSVFAFKGKQSDIRDIALQLNVDKVLEGSVRKAGNRVRITAQLINALDGFHLWSETFDRDLIDIFQVQDEISGIITRRLRKDLLSDQPPRVKAPVKNVNAYTLYLKGLHYWNRVTPADAHQAIRCFEEAIALEPGYALAYAMTALAYSYLGSAGQILPSEAFAAVHKYADKAIELDDTIAEGFVAKGAAYLLYEWNWELGFKALQNAKRVNPRSSAGSDLLAFYYVLMGQTDLAIDTMETAVELDPLSTIMNQALGNAYLFAERYDDAIRQAEKILEMNPVMRSCLELKAWATGMKGDWLQALTLFEEVHRLTGHPLKGLMGLGFTYARLGEREKALECVRKLEQRKAQEPSAIIDADLVTIWFGIGDIDKTIYYIRQCMEKRMAPIEYFVQYPQFKSLRDDPRYKALLDDMAVK
ncbi:MAG TPA: adenylate/guanylate cyclase domain-containing protein [Chryseolinea sp.]|nr:adenylate/guanylate cyclase domain-containing protein [Chryseolinea sp.]